MGYIYQGAYLKGVCGLDPSGACYSGAFQQWLEDVTYDDYGRPWVLALGGGDLTYAYHAPGRRLSQIRFTRAGNGTEELDLNYTYDNVGNVDYLDDLRDLKADGVDATADYDYDNLSRLRSFEPVNDPVNDDRRHFTYDVLGNLTGRDLATASAEPNQLYADPGKPHALTSAPGGGTFLYDADGNVAEKTSPSHHYLRYDSENRLTCVGSTEGGCDVARMTYDVDGRRISYQEGAGPLHLRLGDLYDHTIGAEGTSFVHAFGQRLGERWQATPVLRSAEDPLLGFEVPPDAVPWLAALAVTGLGLVALFQLGALGGLRGRPVQGGLALGAALTLIPYPVAGGPPGGGGSGATISHRWILPDHLGSSTVVVDMYGVAVARRVFEPFGNVQAQWSTETTRQLFTGQELSSATGLYDFRARWYDPQVGRFLSVDPVIADLASPQSHNAFSYVENNPINLVDPTGLGSEGGGSGISWTFLWPGLFDDEDDEDDEWCGDFYGCLLIGRLLDEGYTPEELEHLSILDLTKLLAEIPRDPPCGETTGCGVSFIPLSSPPSREPQSQGQTFGSEPNLEHREGEGPVERLLIDFLAGAYEAHRETTGGVLDKLEQLQNPCGSAEVGCGVVPAIPGRPFSGAGAAQAAFRHLQRFHGIDPKVASTRLHVLKRRFGLGAADDVTIGRTGDVYDAASGERLGTLTDPGLGR